MNNDLEQTIYYKKGNIGESIVNEMYRNAGYILYHPEKGKPHKVDIFWCNEKMNIGTYDTKTKNARLKYPDSGMDCKHYKRYKELIEDHNLSVNIHFVDWWVGYVYGNDLRALEIECVYEDKKYPSTEQAIIYFPLCNMKLQQELFEAEKQEIKKYDSGKFKERYEINKSWDLERFINYIS